MKRLLFFLFILLTLASCTGNALGGQTGEPSDGPLEAKPEDSFSGGHSEEYWRIALQITGEEIPFDLRVQYDQDHKMVAATLLNGEEQVEIPGFSHSADSISLPFSVFNSEIRAEIKGDALDGIWYNHARKNKNRLPLLGEKTPGLLPRFSPSSDAEAKDFNGKWEVEFVYQGTEKSKAIGIFEQDGNALHGTFRTETGDYRYLVGAVMGHEMKLSTFDGAHAFLFHAEKLEDGSLEGKFWSGDHWIETWTAFRNPDFELNDPDSLTYMKPGETTLDFSFINTDRQPISPSDDRFQGKALIVQIMGTWCPNCKDETSWLTDVYADYQSQDLEVISLAFELSDDTTKAISSIQKLKDHFQTPYEVLFAGRAGKKTAGAALPQLNHVMSYPTTVFMDRNHQVQRIYTGFNGPATGAVYEKLLTSFGETIRKMLTPS